MCETWLCKVGSKNVYVCLPISCEFDNEAQCRENEMKPQHLWSWRSDTVWISRISSEPFVRAYKKKATVTRSICEIYSL